MEIVCAVCESLIPQPIYQSQSSQSITSLCHLLQVSTQVWFCEKCDHLMTTPLDNSDNYYASDYKINLNHEDEDQIYEVVNQEVIYRTDHQLKILNQKLSLVNGLKVLDYGCAKASMASKLLKQVPDLDFYLFDVSEMYKPYWERLIPSHKYAVNYIPNEWEENFDLIISFFSMEHIATPRKAAECIFSLLKEDGIFYAVVPDTFTNVADFAVVDHVNHFTQNSMIKLLQDVGFQSIEIDNESHRGVLIVLARKQGSTISKPIPNINLKVNELARFWNSIGDQVNSSELIYPAPSAIYGSGFYGAFIYSCLKRPKLIKVFLDKSPFQQGCRLFNVPIVSPEAIPKEVKTLYVGLNPKIARQAIASQPHLNRSDLNLIFLDSIE
jgi:SAM-dependent methyltransferase